MIRKSTVRGGAKLAALGLFVPAAVMSLAPVAHAAAPNKPTLMRVMASSIPVMLGQTTSANAVLSGSFPTTGGNGSITFTLYGPYAATATPDCKSGKLVYTSPSVPTNGDNTYNSPPSAYPITAPGTYEWVASYSGDTYNTATASSCGDAAVTVAMASPTVATTPSSPTVVTVGAKINDAATLAGGYGLVTTGNKKGTVTFTLYNITTEGATPTCAATDQVFQDPNENITANTGDTGGTASSSKFSTTSAGLYQWVASYSGDANNSAFTGACGDTTEQVTVQATPTIVTTPTTP